VSAPTPEVSIDEAIIDRLGGGDLGLTVLPDGSGVMLDMSGHRVLSLSKTGVVLVEQMQAGRCRLDDLATALVEGFDVGFDEARRDAGEFLASLNEALSKPES
jgi:hypothetical protein